MVKTILLRTLAILIPPTQTMCVIALIISGAWMSEFKFERGEEATVLYAICVFAGLFAFVFGMIPAASVWGMTIEKKGCLLQCDCEYKDPEYKIEITEGVNNEPVS